MNVLSLFDGMSCGQIALNKVGIKYENYFASEIDKHAIKVTQHNYPNTKHIGNVTKVKGTELPKIDLLIGGSPCQGFSFAGKQLNFEDERSKLFFEYVRLLKECKPKYFLLENVKMKKEYQDIISSYLGVEPIKINSSLVSAQSRERYYWTNINIITELPPLKINKEEILEEANTIKFVGQENYKLVQLEKLYKLGGVFPTQLGNSKQFCNSISFGDKFFTLRASNPNGVIFKKVGTEFEYRKLTPIECERLQTVPDNYTEGVSNTQRYKMLGNGWTVDVIAHIFNQMVL